MRLLAALFAAAVLGFAPAARAQTITINTVVRTNSPRAPELPGGVVSSDLPIGLRDCTCENWRVTGSFSGSVTGASPRFEYWVGTTSTACATLMNRAGSGTTVPSCWQIPDDIVASVPITTSFTVDIPSVLLVNPLDRTCTPLPGRSLSGSVFFTVLARGPDDMTPNVTREIAYNLEQPVAPTSVTATAQEGSAQVVWSVSNSATDDAGAAVLSPSIAGFYALCFPGPPATFDAGFRDACPGGLINVGDAHFDVSDTGVFDDATDVGVDGFTDVVTTDTGTLVDAVGADVTTTCAQASVPAGFDANDDTQFQRYKCSDLRGRTDTTFTVQGLSNGVPYRFGVVTQDTAGNRSAVVATTACITPQPITDFWEHYHGSGGAAQPGFCATRPGPVAFRGIVPVAFAIVGLVAWRRRRKRSKSDTRGDA